MNTNALRNVLSVGGLAICVSLSPHAVAEPVRVESASGQGQGWVFSQSGACFVLTAAHVARPGALVRSAFGVEGQAVEMWRHPQASDTPGEGVDIALLRVEGALAARCPASSLGYDNVGPTLERIRVQRQPIALDQAAEGGRGVQTYPVSLLGVDADGMTFTVREATGVQGDSGSVVRFQGSALGEAGLPIGIVSTEIADGAGVYRVMRFDAARKFARDTIQRSRAVPGAVAAPGGAASRLRTRLAAWRGDTRDPNCGPMNAVSANPACGWRAAPQIGWTSVDLDFVLEPAPGAVSGVNVTLDGAGDGVGLEVSVTGEPPEDARHWISVRVCRAQDASLIQCNFNPRAANGVRVRIFGPFEAIRNVTLR